MDRISIHKTSTGIFFPEWRSLILQLANSYAEKKGLESSIVRSMLKAYSLKLPSIKDQIRENPPIVVMSTLVMAEAIYEAGPDIMEMMENLRRSKLGSNEFFAIYDIAERRYCYIDPSMSDCLGIDAKDFNIESILGIHPSRNLCHPDDSPHKIRWAGIAYLILSLPGFCFKSLNEHYSVSVRIDTSASTRPDLAEAKIAVLNKRSYLTINEHDHSSGAPRYHIDKFSLLDKSLFSYVRPSFESDFIQSEFMNALAYLVNCAIIDIDPKFVIMLDEKAKNDRNKAVTNAINSNLKEVSNVDMEFTENQVADCFTKTIRGKVERASNLWRRPDSPIHVLSDSDAVEQGKVLGIVPMPPQVKEMLYRGIDTKPED